MIDRMHQRTSFCRKGKKVDVLSMHGASLRKFHPRKRDDQLPCFDQHMMQCILVDC